MNLPGLSAEEISLWTMLGTWAALAGVLVAVRMQNNSTRRLNRQQLFFQFYALWESPDMQRRRSALALALLNESSTVASVDDAPLVFLNTISHSTKRGLVDEELVWIAFSVDICQYFFAAKTYLKRLRQMEKEPTLFRELEVAYDRFLARQLVETGASRIGRDADSCRRFLEGEVLRK